MWIIGLVWFLMKLSMVIFVNYWINSRIVLLPFKAVHWYWPCWSVRLFLCGPIWSISSSGPMSIIDKRGCDWILRLAFRGLLPLLPVCVWGWSRRYDTAGQNVNRFSFLLKYQMHPSDSDPKRYIGSDCWPFRWSRTQLTERLVFDENSYLRVRNSCSHH